jgi:toxin CcdB
MAQFDVHRNAGVMRSTIPYIVVVQSSQFDVYRRRVVVPLVLQKSLPNQITKAASKLNPVFEIEGQKVMLHPLDMVSIAINKLGDYVMSLADDGITIADALDDLLTRTWR